MQASAFIAREIQAAVAAQASAWLGLERSEIRSPFSAEALRHFGNALHTITDRESPYHEGFASWDPISVRGQANAAWHGFREWLWGSSRETELALARHNAMVEWSTFVWASEQAVREARK